MATTFQTIGLISKLHHPEVTETLSAVINHLQSKQLNIVLEEKTAKTVPDCALPVVSREQLGKDCDLLIVVGGDGSLLNVAQTAAMYDVPILGVNRGSLGFLTDIKPAEFNNKIDSILSGEYIEEKRFLLESSADDQCSCSALNEVMLVRGDTSKMIEFEIYIDDVFMCSQRSDGVIIATPTGSTAYALSGGGPILHPNLDAIVMVPMCPHTLSSRPIVLEGDRCIRVVIAESTKISPRISCDNQSCIDIKPGSQINIRKMDKPLRLIHAPGYDYFETLRSKLHWGRELIDND